MSYDLGTGNQIQIFDKDLHFAERVHIAIDKKNSMFALGSGEGLSVTKFDNIENSYNLIPLFGSGTNGVEFIENSHLIIERAARGRGLGFLRLRDAQNFQVLAEFPMNVSSLTV